MPVCLDNAKCFLSMQSSLRLLVQGLPSRVQCKKPKMMFCSSNSTTLSDNLKVMMHQT